MGGSIVINRKPLDEDMQYVTSYVGSDEIEGGRIQANFIVKHVSTFKRNTKIFVHRELNGLLFYLFFDKKYRFHRD